ncbi:CPBP family intramembrane glutamic endopeptidase [Acetoanaerobium pronyense]|uniref:CPBP family intramembrane glutamic endopeptidase n=1 Tax=Acetoanaerobium pronyense TaxID=1482736 RepID=UPI002ED2E63D
MLQQVSWLNFSSFNEIFLLSLRAGLHEEIIFRLFVFSMFTYLISKNINSKEKAIFGGIVLSSLLFSLMHGGLNIVAFVFGAVLAYIFYNNGLIPAIIIHFLANLIPWTLFWNL